MALTDASAARSADGNPLSTYQDDWLDCRGMQHSWRSVGWYQSGSDTCRLTVCERCSTQKISYFDRHGYISRASKYMHPEGYSLAGTDVTTPDVRREIMRRAIGQKFGSLNELQQSFAQRAEESAQAKASGKTVADRRAARRVS